MHQKNTYSTDGYRYFPQFFSAKELEQLEAIVVQFHSQTLFFCDDHPHFRSFIDSNNHPTSAEKQQLKHTDLFL